MKTYVSVHDVRTIEAVAPGSLGAPLIITLAAEDGLPAGSITLFLDNHILADNLVSAINGASAHKCAPDSAHEEAHNAAVTAYEYRGSNR